MATLTERLIDLEYHPVLVFGPSGSGKTVLLQSLISSLTNTPDSGVSPSLGVKLIPDDYEKAKERIEDGEYFFSDEVPKFDRGELPVKTQREYPFFIPVVFDCPDASTKTVRLAFLEGMGEWYEMSGGRSTYPKFKGEIVEILSEYKDLGISLIYVAPTFSPLSEFQFPDVVRAKLFDEALKGIIKEYGETRVEKVKDNQLFLVSKWDTLFSDHEVNARLAEDHLSRFRDHVFGANGHYRGSWNAFANRVAPISDSLAAMPYTACRVRSNRIVHSPQLTSYFVHFNRTLANWLYGNATQSAGGTRETLFPDVVPSRSRLGAWYDRFVYFSVSGWR
jgi:hypothetical protein